MATATIQPIQICEAYSPEWYALRCTGLGSSELAAAAGLSKWTTPRELYHRKRGELPDKEETRAMRLGRLLEPFIVQEFCAETGKAVELAPCPMYQHPDHAWLFSTPDALLTGEEVLEAKATQWRLRSEWGQKGTDDIPIDYVCQVQGTLAVVGREVGYVACMVDGRELLQHTVIRNDKLIEELITAAGEFWRRVVNGEPPDPDWEHASTPDLIKRVYGSIVEGTRVELSLEAAEAWLQYEALGKQIRELEKQRDMLKARALAEVGENEAGILPGGKEAVFRTQVYRAGYVVNESSYILAKRKSLTKGKAKKK